uniref:NADH dehydrogenase subunit 4L n=1 Tax=Pylorgus porrectus TaxID=3051108 RepID=UPI0025A9612A|nr:NADH dehydrogenase subunit 4L [Pylorgus porrectus]WIF28482.1 NADH dehydrogenase subunit 4L [Pylorgus porrectus]
MYMIMVLMFLSGVISYCLVHSHLLIMLFSLEYLVLVLLLSLFYYLMFLGVESYFILFFMVFAVCEGALGLGVLVNLIRNHGNDYLMSMSILSW